MARRMKEKYGVDWLEGYLRYTEDTEPARIFQKWTGLSVIAAALRKKVSLSLGRIRVYPNLYIVFVAEPGVARKSRAIDFGLELVNEIPEIKTCADATTREALIQDLELCKVEELMHDGSIFHHSSLSVISREFESFLGQKKENTKMLVLLTDLFDSQELPWKYRTKNSGDNIVPSIYLNLLAATTPESISSCLPSTAVGGGLTSRIMFVWAERKYKKKAFPELTEEVKNMKMDLIHDLYQISRIVGRYEMTPSCKAFWQDWYDTYDENSPSRMCKDPSFTSWYSRKPTYVLKLSMIAAASESSDLNVTEHHIHRSISFIEEIERDMGHVFKAMGKSTVTVEVELVSTLIRTRRVISEKDLLSLTWRDLDKVKFDNVIATVIAKGDAVRTFQGPHGEKGDIWYWKPDYLEKLQKNALERKQALALDQPQKALNPSEN